MTPTTSDLKPKSYNAFPRRNLSFRKRRSYVSPLHKLPPEILITIFQHGERTSRYLNFDRETIPFPVRISHVCRLWRDIAIDVSALWIDVRVYDIRDPERQGCLARMYMERSKSCLIDVSYHSYGCTSESIEVFILFLRNELLPHIGRVRQLTIIAAYDSLLRSVLTVFEDVAAPKLESLRFSVLDVLGYSPYFGQLITEPSPIFNGGAPLLSSISFHGISCINQPQFTKIRSLSLDVNMEEGNVSLDGFHALLSTISPTLERLNTCGVIFDPEPFESNVQIITLPVLTYLRLIDVPIFPFLDTPRLKRIYLEETDSSTTEALVQRCSSAQLPLLTSLELWGVDLGAFEHKFDVLRGIQNLEILKLVDCTQECLFLELLKEEESSVSVRKKNKNKSRRKRQRSPTPLISDILLPRQSSSSQKISPDVSTKSTKPVILPRLRSITISSKKGLRLLQPIITDRMEAGYPISHLRCTSYDDENIRVLSEEEDEGHDLYEETDPDDEESMLLEQEEDCFNEQVCSNHQLSDSQSFDLSDGYSSEDFEY